MYYIICEQQFSQSIWCQKIVGSLENELKKRRNSFQWKNTPDGLTAEDTVFLVGADHLWLQEAVAACNSMSNIPILLSSSAHFPGGQYHAICADITGTMHRAITALRQEGCQTVALYGINPASVSDLARAEAFSAELPEGRIFENNGSLAACFEQFLPFSACCDAILCANSFAAISLARRLKEAAPECLQKLQIISCTEARLTEHYPCIRSMEMNYEPFGPAAMAVANILKKQPYIAGIIVRIGERTPPSGGKSFSPPRVADRFYTDNELMEMMLLERLLENCDDTDRKILALLIREQPNAVIADACYFTESSVKYRIRKMTELCNTPDRKSLVGLLKKYL